MSQRKAGVTIISHKIEFKAKNITTDKNDDFIMVNEANQENIILNT